MSIEATLPPFPPNISFDTPQILKSLISAHRGLAELKGTAKSLPNQDILLNTLFLQEALASSKIENIVTTQDEAFQETLFSGEGSVEAKEVARYCGAMWHGYNALQENHSITESMLIDMVRILKQNKDGYRKTAVVLSNQKTGEVVYTPPENGQDVILYMRDLATFIKDDTPGEIDSLVKMALIHHQFESIHPFIDGNGRIGRILNVLYLTHVGLLDVPILYLSRAINRTKLNYYRRLQAVRAEKDWEGWIIYMLDAVTETATSILKLISSIRDLMASYKKRIRTELPNVYSQDLLNNLFRHPYTRIEYLVKDLNKSRPTVNSYLEKLVKHGFVTKNKTGRNNYYINEPLVNLFLGV